MLGGRTVWRRLDRVPVLPGKNQASWPTRKCHEDGPRSRATRENFDQTTLPRNSDTAALFVELIFEPLDHGRPRTTTRPLRIGGRRLYCEEAGKQEDQPEGFRVKDFAAHVQAPFIQADAGQSFPSSIMFGSPRRTGSYFYPLIYRERL